MVVYRIVRERFARDVSGEGAKLYGGRWNSIGTPCIYTSTNVSLCLCEYLVNLPSYLLPADLQLVSYELPESKLVVIDPKDIPNGWDRIPVSNTSQKFGDQLLQAVETLAFSIPSVIIPQEKNIIINSHANEFANVKIRSVEAFKLDKRFEK